MKTVEPKDKTTTIADKSDGSEQEQWLEETLRHVRETQFGQVTLTIHHGEVIEVQKTEKRRFNCSRNNNR